MILFVWLVKIFNFLFSHIYIFYNIMKVYPTAFKLV